MTFQLAGILGGAASFLGVISALIVALRRSKSDSDDSWQRRVRDQLEWQITRNLELSERLACVEQALQAHTRRISMLEQLLRSNGIEVP